MDTPNASVQTKNEKLNSHHETDIAKVNARVGDVLAEIDPET